MHTMRLEKTTTISYAELMNFLIEKKNKEIGNYRFPEHLELLKKW